MKAIGIDIKAAPHSKAPAAYLYGPSVDFLLLGGGSLIVLLVIRLLVGGSEDARIWSLGTTFALANFINHPHFAHSYQIFYADFREKLTGERYSIDMRLRYIFVGLIAPPAICLLLAWPVIAGEPRILGLAANAMFFLVGWHYVKQGYGMAMVDAVLKQAFYNNHEKRALLLNAYVVWIFSWLLINYLLANKAPNYWDVPYFVVPVPLWLILTAGSACLVMSIRLAVVLWHKKQRGPVAWNGLLAYVTSLYAWLLVRDPVVLLWIPLFHSLQYLAVVWRFQKRRIDSQPRNGIDPKLRMALFLVMGFGLGYAGFWMLPDWLNRHIEYDQDLFGVGLFFYLSWIFINVHHYLLDSVMWRKGNPDVSSYLFDVRAK